MDGTSILCYTGAVTNATKLRQKGTKLIQGRDTALPNCILNIL